MTTGAISGRVVDEKGAALAGFDILVVTASDRSVVDDVVTGGDGTYVVPGLPDGSYFVDAFNGNENRHVDTWYPNVWDTDFWRNLVAATPVVVSNGGTGTANFSLPIGARVRLTLKDPSGAPIIVPPRKNGIPGCWGSMYVSVNGQPYQVNGSCIGGHSFGDGTYEPYIVPQGRTYFLKAWPAGFPYAPVYYDQKATLETATPIPLASEGPLPITIQMGTVGHAITGKYSFSTPQDQIVSASATVDTADGTPLQTLDAASDGTYAFGGISDGDYVVQLRVTAVKSGKRTLHFDSAGRGGARARPGARRSGVDAASGALHRPRRDLGRSAPAHWRTARRPVARRVAHLSGGDCDGARGVDGDRDCLDLIQLARLGGGGADRVDDARAAWP